VRGDPHRTHPLLTVCNGPAHSGAGLAAGSSSSTPRRMTPRWRSQAICRMSLPQRLPPRSRPEFLELAAGAYRDGTRVAASDTALWAGIFVENRGPLLDALSVFESELGGLRRALEGGDFAAVHALWEVARKRRASFDPP